LCLLAKITTVMNKWRASQDVHDLHCREIFPLNRCAKSYRSC
jgi:hypothetical protein